MYSELITTTNFSFLHGASHPEEYVFRAAELGYRAIAVTDHHSLAGIVRGHIAAKEAGIKYAVGARVELGPRTSGPQQPGLGTQRDTSEHCGPEVRGPRMLPLIIYPTNRTSYGTLCRFLSLGRQRSKAGTCLLTLEDLLAVQNEFVTIVSCWSAGENARAPEDLLQTIVDNAKDKDLLSIALHRSYYAGNRAQFHSALAAAKYYGIKTVATNAPLYHIPERKPVQDLLTCIRLGCTIEQAGFQLEQNAERHLKPPEEMVRLFAAHPEAIRRTEEIAEMLNFSLDELRYDYPDAVCPTDKTPLEYLTELTFDCAAIRYPGGVPEKVERLLHEELALIHELGYEKYFLTCHDIVRFARSRKILCQGRGAAANSAVCFVLGITAVDPDRIETLFARFVSKERSEPPDIDIDFEHERREEVIQYIYRTYGRDFAGLTCEVITYRHRSAVRDVGKALGLPLPLVDKLTKLIHRWTDCHINPADLIELGLNPNDRTIQRTILLANQILGFPRHLSQHVGGFVISQTPLCELVPVINASMDQRTIIEWDKDDIEALGMLKIDVLGLGMLTAIRKAIELVNQRRAAEQLPEIELDSIPAEDPAVYEMICNADTVGVFQIESRAQMSMLPRLKPKKFYDLVIEVAIVRPGPIQGKMVHPFLKRRAGLEQPYYPDQRVRDVLGKTLGVPLFQEQAMRLAIVMANFSPGEAEQLRRAMAAWRRNKRAIAKFQEQIMAGMLANGYTAQFAESCISQLKGFSEYGFPESHAASFALLVYASAWLKCHYPAEFAAALINSQPMGFYAPAQIVSDAKDHGATILPIDIQKSSWDCALEGRALRLGMRLVRGLGKEQAEIISRIVSEAGPFSSVQALWCAGTADLRSAVVSTRLAARRLKALRTGGPRTQLSKNSLIALARADAFGSFGLTRRTALWEIKALPEPIAPLDQFETSSQPIALKPIPSQQDMFQDYNATGLSLKAHPISFIRQHLDSLGVYRAIDLKQRTTLPQNRTGKVAGLVLFRQRPGTAKGTVFLTLEDETGVTNLFVRPQIFERYRTEIISSASLLAHGTIELVGPVVYLNATHLESLDRRITGLEEGRVKARSYSY